MSAPADDPYLILEAWTRKGDATLRLSVNPLVMWIWAGGLVMAGAVIAVLPEWRAVRVSRPVPSCVWSPVRHLKASDPERARCQERAARLKLLLARQGFP